MLCQNCNQREATTHIKRSVNGEVAESHLCGECAKKLGYTDIFSGFGLNLSDFFGGFFEPQTESLADVHRCEKCGNSLHDIIRDGKVGCANCYRTFYDALLPMIERIHGSVHHTGKTIESTEPSIDYQAQREAQIKALREKIQQAVATEDYETAAKLRDEIKKLEGKENA